MDPFLLGVVGIAGMIVSGIVDTIASLFDQLADTNIRRLFLLDPSDIIIKVVSSTLVLPSNSSSVATVPPITKVVTKWITDVMTEHVTTTSTVTEYINKPQDHFASQTNPNWASHLTRHLINGLISMVIFGIFVPAYLRRRNRPEVVEVIQVSVAPPLDQYWSRWLSLLQTPPSPPLPPLPPSPTFKNVSTMTRENDKSQETGLAIYNLKKDKATMTEPATQLLSTDAVDAGAQNIVQRIVRLFIEVKENKISDETRRGLVQATVDIIEHILGRSVELTAQMKHDINHLLIDVIDQHRDGLLQTYGIVRAQVKGSIRSILNEIFNEQAKASPKLKSSQLAVFDLDSIVSEQPDFAPHVKLSDARKHWISDAIRSQARENTANAYSLDCPSSRAHQESIKWTRDFANKTATRLSGFIGRQMEGAIGGFGDPSWCSELEEIVEDIRKTIDHITTASIHSFPDCRNEETHRGKMRKKVEAFSQNSTECDHFSQQYLDLERSRRFMVIVDHHDPAMPAANIMCHLSQQHEDLYSLLQRDVEEFFIDLGDYDRRLNCSRVLQENSYLWIKDKHSGLLERLLKTKDHLTQCRVNDRHSIDHHANIASESAVQSYIDAPDNSTFTHQPESASSPPLHQNTREDLETPSEAEYQEEESVEDDANPISQSGFDSFLRCDNESDEQQEALSTPPVEDERNPASPLQTSPEGPRGVPDVVSVPDVGPADQEASSRTREGQEQSQAHQEAEEGPAVTPPTLIAEPAELPGSEVPATTGAEPEGSEATEKAREEARTKAKREKRRRQKERDDQRKGAEAAADSAEQERLRLEKEREEEAARVEQERTERERLAIQRQEEEEAARAEAEKQEKERVKEERRQEDERLKNVEEKERLAQEKRQTQDEASERQRQRLARLHEQDEQRAREAEAKRKQAEAQAELAAQARKHEDEQAAAVSTSTVEQNQPDAHLRETEPQVINEREVSLEDSRIVEGFGTFLQAAADAFQEGDEMDYLLEDEENGRHRHADCAPTLAPAMEMPDQPAFDMLQQQQGDARTDMFAEFVPSPVADQDMNDPRASEPIEDSPASPSVTADLDLQQGQDDNMFITNDEQLSMGDELTEAMEILTNIEFENTMQEMHTELLASEEVDQAMLATAVENTDIDIPELPYLAENTDFDLPEAPAPVENFDINIPELPSLEENVEFDNLQTQMMQMLVQDSIYTGPMESPIYPVQNAYRESMTAEEALGIAPGDVTTPLQIPEYCPSQWFAAPTTSSTVSNPFLSISHLPESNALNQVQPAPFSAPYNVPYRFPASPNYVGQAGREHGTQQRQRSTGSSASNATLASNQLEQASSQTVRNHVQPTASAQTVVGSQNTAAQSARYEYELRILLDTLEDSDDVIEVATLALAQERGGRPTEPTQTPTEWVNSLRREVLAAAGDEDGYTYEERLFGPSLGRRQAGTENISVAVQPADFEPATGIDPSTLANETARESGDSELSTLLASSPGTPPTYEDPDDPRFLQSIQRALNSGGLQTEDEWNEMRRRNANLTLADFQNRVPRPPSSSSSSDINIIVDEEPEAAAIEPASAATAEAPSSSNSGKRKAVATEPSASESATITEQDYRAQNLDQTFGPTDYSDSQPSEKDEEGQGPVSDQDSEVSEEDGPGQVPSAYRPRFTPSIRPMLRQGLLDTDEIGDWIRTGTLPSRMHSTPSEAGPSSSTNLGGVPSTIQNRFPTTDLTASASVTPTALDSRHYPAPLAAQIQGHGTQIAPPQGPGPASNATTTGLPSNNVPAVDPSMYLREEEEDMYGD